MAKTNNVTWYLEYALESGEHQKLRVDEGRKITVGRGSASDTKIPDPALSRLHCEVELLDGCAFVRDLNSATGTYFNQAKVAEQQLAAGEGFQAGNIQFRIVCESDLDAPTLAPKRTSSQSLTDKLMKFLEENKEFDRFTIKRLINRSGNNLVYKAADSDSGRAVAIKIFPTSPGGEEDESRFVRAMKIFQDIADPRVVKLYRAGRKKHFCWIAMEWFEEGSVKDRIERQGIDGVLPWRDAWRIARSIAKSLHLLETHQIVHRNIRPTNILYRSKDDSWVLSDLVVAKAQELTGGAQVTQQVFLPSDLAYTAPERLTGRDIQNHSLQADIYSLGAVLTEVLTGEPPYGKGSLPELVARMKQPRKVVEYTSQIGLNELFVDFVNRLTEPASDKRFPTAESMWEQVQRVGMLAGMSVS